MESNSPESSDAEELTPSAIFSIAWDIRDGNANPADARRLLEKFCNDFDKGMFRTGMNEQDYLLRHIRDSFCDYLDNEKKTIEAALGLVKKKGRPKADEQVRMKMAAEVLRYRMGGGSHQDALTEVSKTFCWGETIVGEAWAAWQFEAIIVLRCERPLDEFPWTPDEIKKMDEIFGDKPWYVMPGKAPPWDIAPGK